MKAIIKEVLITVLIAVVVFFALQFTIQSSIVVGMSMEPTFEDGQRLLVSKAAYAFTDPAPGDVIIFHPPVDYGKDYIKRVIGVPGDVIEVKNHAVYINGKKLNEPYIKDAPNYIYGPVTVPENSYFVLGDNRNNSNDSHRWGFVSRESVVGKAWFSYWPLSEFGKQTNYPLGEQT